MSQVLDCKALKSSVKWFFFTTWIYFVLGPYWKLSVDITFWYSPPHLVTSVFVHHLHQTSRQSALSVVVLISTNIHAVTHPAQETSLRINSRETFMHSLVRVSLSSTPHSELWTAMFSWGVDPDQSVRSVSIQSRVISSLETTFCDSSPLCSNSDSMLAVVTLVALQWTLAVMSFDWSRMSTKNQIPLKMCRDSVQNQTLSCIPGLVYIDFISQKK